MAVQNLATRPNRFGTPWPAVLLLCWLPLVALGDALSTPPAPFKDRLVPVAETDLSGAEPAAREAMKLQRRETARVLQGGDAEDGALAEAYGRLGALYHVHGLVTAAESSYHNAMTLEPGRFRWVYYAAYLAAHYGRHQQALDRYQRARILRPDYRPLTLREGKSLLELGRLDESTKALESAAEEPGLRPRALYLLAQIHLLRHQPEAAVPLLQEVLELDPEANAAHYPLARALRATGEDAAAREHMTMRGDGLPRADDPLVRELEALNQGARPHFTEGLRAGRDRDFEAAVKAFAEGLAIEPDNADARVSYARALYLSGDTATARDELETVLANNPDHVLALFLSGLLLEEAGEPEQAAARYRQVLKLEPTHYGAHFCLANQLYLSGEYRAATRHYDAALEANPDIPPARLYALLARKRGGMEDTVALARLETLTRKYPEQQSLTSALIRLLVLSDDPAVRDTERARRLVNDLVQEAFIPPHVALQALVAASLGAFDQAVELQEQVLPALVWTDPALGSGAEAALAAYGDRHLPDLAWHDETAVLRPPRTDVRLMMMEYPSPVPY